MFEQKKKIVAKIFENNFYIHSNIVTKKWWEKMRETIFPETNEWFKQKCWGKKSSPKSAKNVFYIHTNIVTKKVGVKTRAIIFPETHE